MASSLTSCIHQDTLTTYPKYLPCVYSQPQKNCPAYSRECYNCSGLNHYPPSVRNSRELTEPTVTAEPDLPETAGHIPKCTWRGTPGWAAGDDTAILSAGRDSPTISQAEVPWPRTPIDHNTEADAVSQHTSTVRIALRSSPHNAYIPIASPVPYARKAPSVQIR